MRVITIMEIFAFLFFLAALSFFHFGFSFLVAKFAFIHFFFITTVPVLYIVSSKLCCLTQSTEEKET